MTNQDARATASALVEANLFDIVAPIRINYASSSITGAPRLSYKDAELDLHFQGDEIIRMQTALAELITVTLENPPDAFMRTFTIIVPTIRMSPGGETEFGTLGIETIDRSGSFVPPAGPAGVLQTYRAHQLHGSAQHVNF